VLTYKISSNHLTFFFHIKKKYSKQFSFLQPDFLPCFPASGGHGGLIHPALFSLLMAKFCAAQRLKQYSYSLASEYNHTFTLNWTG
jgi:hypothetical protein